ncbi:PAS domain-containing protein [Roseomonas sp. SSH11]|uniref:histidine kinase n=1 Tax=Pararoseomonas baculiformis TaxID=2820812 RepID=A0ABS4AKU8_9PROT|nr:ATP-binding protein [Pararoseomonas baculiformis]MBP0447631.1 PAS domain-containing protein [Pararoseomonas baculiformis]
MTDPTDKPETATGRPAEGSMDQGALEPLGRPGLHHWRQAEITDTTLDERGSVFFAAVEMTRMPMILADPRQDDCPIAFANNAFLDLTGYEEAEVVGRNCRFLQGAGTDPAHVRQLRDAIQEKRPTALEILNYRRDGTPFWNAIFMGPVFDKAGELIYFFASQLDVSKRRESEQQLRQAQKMEAIGQLTAGLAHDFNNLLHVIDGSLERLKAKRFDDRAFERFHEAAVAASDRGAKLTRQLLAFARRTRLEPKGVDLTHLVNSFSELLETSVGERADLHLNLQRRLPQVRVDPNHLEMALLNVVVNARDASPKGGAITVTTRAIHLNGDAVARHLEPGDYVMLCVSDEGVGMPPHVQARAIEPFFTTKGPQHGTGLGLAMVHGFVQQSGGRLEIESEPGRGTTVRMIFPKFVPLEERNGEAAGRTGYQAEPVEAAARVPLILVVDDSREVAELARDALVETGYRVAVAHSAEEAIAAFDQASETGDAFDLVFSDVLMPGGANGLVLAEQVRERSPLTPIVLTTGYNDEMSIDGPKMDVMDVLGKPYKRAELIGRIQAALRRGARTDPGRDTSGFGHAQA